MSVTKVHGLAPVTLNATHLCGITSFRLPIGSQLRGTPTSAIPYPRFISLVRSNPGMEFSTLNVAAALTLVGPMGASIAGDLGDVAKGYATKFEQAASITAGGTHRSFLFAFGMVLPVGLSCAENGDAEISYVVVGYSNAGADPVIITESVSLPASTDTERFTLGDTWTIGAVAIGQPRSLNIDFGITPKSLADAKEIYPSFVWKGSVNPVITATGFDIELLKAANIPLAGKAGTHANTKFFLAKRAQAGRLVSDVTAEHIKFTADGMCVIEDGFSVAGQDEGEVSLRMECRYDGSNAPIIVDPASAIA